MARALRRTESSASRDAALLTLLGRERSETSPFGNSSEIDAIGSDNSDNDAALDSIDDVFAELALL
jgi:hypothetical protein